MQRKFFILILVTQLMMTGCASVLGGQKTDHQRHRPECGEPRRQLRVGMIIADLVLFPPGLIIDFATRKIYKPFPNANRTKHCKNESANR